MREEEGFSAPGFLIESMEGCPAFWSELIMKAAHIDYGEALPELDDQFLSVWSSHYAHIAVMTKPKAPLLEIGTGFGVLASGLGQITRGDIWSTEHPSRAYLFREAYRDFVREHGVRLVANDLVDGLPFSTGSVAQVYLCDVIEHLSYKDGTAILDEIVRVLPPGGELILSTPNLNRLSNAIRFFKGHSVNPPFQVQQCGDTYGHIREFAPREMAMLLRRHGMEPKRCTFGLNPYFTADAFGEENIFSPKAVRMINRLTGLFARFFPSVGDEMYILACRL